MSNKTFAIVAVICVALGFVLLKTAKSKVQTDQGQQPRTTRSPSAANSTQTADGSSTAAQQPTSGQASGGQTGGGQAAIASLTSDPLPSRKQKVLLELDPDGNGLYDDAERKKLLDVLQQECPALQATYDADGDGKVTVEEQTADRHPLSQLVPKSLLDSDRKIPWAINIFSEWLMSAYLQEDAAKGEISEHAPRGTVQLSATQANADLRPRKSSDRGGVEFAANSGQFATIPGHRDARWNYRWCLFTFRIDANSGTDKETVLLDLNQGKTSNKSSPKIWYSRESGLNIQYVGDNKGGLDRRIMTADNVVADGKTWNVLVCGIRYGQMYAAVNGVDLATKTPQPERFCGDWPRDTTSYLGDQSKGNMAWAYDALVFGQTEPSEAMVRKMTGWAAHRLGFQASLPANHPYRAERPILDEEDLPYRYLHDDEKWNAWGATLKDKSETRVNAGGPRLEPQGFERVFYDDFRADRVKASTSGEGDLWVGPGWNTAVGVDAPLVTPGRKPDAYPYDAKNQKQILSLVKEGKKWRGSAFYSVNDLGHGYTWIGPKVFRIRCMFPNVPQRELAGGLFPAFWSYSTDWLFWRTANRIECDWFEFDGQNGRWLNGISSHFHYCHVKNIFAKNPKSYKRYKVYGGELNEAKGKIPGGLYFWDGQYHTWEFVVDRDMTYINVTIPGEDGKDRWVEVCRCKTAPTYLERLDLQLDYALKANHGTPKNGERQDFVVDFIEVLQKTSDIEKVPAPFAGKPTLMGEARVGGTITCQPNVPGIRDVRYYWFADGYPLTYGPTNTWTITKAEAGTELRCMVKAVGALDMPEAWSDPVSIK